MKASEENKIDKKQTWRQSLLYFLFFQGPYFAFVLSSHSGSKTLHAIFHVANQRNYCIRSSRMQSVIIIIHSLCKP